MLLWGILPDSPDCRWLPVPASFKTGSVPLAAESAEPDARLFHKPAVAEPENALAEVNAYFHERRSLNNFHRDRVITFEQIAE
ncbi:hypothetical protein BON71_17830, partial [Escherichia coli]